MLDEKNKHSFCKHGRRKVKTQPFNLTGYESNKTSDKTDLLNTAINELSKISEPNLRNSVQSLSDFLTRHTRSPNISDVTNWLTEQFNNYGYTDVFLHPFGQDRFHNVICKKPTENANAGTIILCGHFDSLNLNSNDVNAVAPGANDNASGIAVILEIARLIANVSMPHNLQFACFTGEEQGYLGAKAYAEKINSDQTNLHFLLNLDQIAYPSAEKQIVIEHDSGNSLNTNNAASQDLARRLAFTIEDRLNLSTLSAEIERSDYMPFEELGYTVIGLYESGDYNHAHTAQDTIEKVDFDYLINMVKTVYLAMYL